MLGYEKAPSSLPCQREMFIFISIQYVLNIGYLGYIGFIQDVQNIGCQLYYTLSFRILGNPLKGTPLYWRCRPPTYSFSSDTQLARKAFLSGLLQTIGCLCRRKSGYFLWTSLPLPPTHPPQINLRKETEEGSGIPLLAVLVNTLP